MHPIVKQLSPHPKQELAILTRNCDVVVIAGAGTGKTRTLVARYLSLLGEGLSLRSIVAITFTKKAAREMRNRLRERIRIYLESLDLDDDERRLWQQHYGELDAARVSTIHSLCIEILRAHPAEAGVDPRFSILDEGQASVLREQVVVESLAWAANIPEVAPLFTLHGDRDLRKTLSTLLTKRLEVDALIAFPPADLLSHWQQVLVKRQSQVHAALLNNKSWQAAAAVIQTNQSLDEADKLELERRKALAALNETTGLLADLNNLDSRVGSAKNWPGGSVQVADVRSALKTLKELWRRQANILTLALGDWDKTIADAIPRLHRLFSFACNRYQVLKQERNSLDFDDLEDKTRVLLRDHESVRQRWQTDIEAILVDEFQDTNARQDSLVTYLNGNLGRLFIVADAKQSIYRFRGADVTVFQSKRIQIEVDGGKPVSLDRSYRAHKALIEGMNALLAPVLGTTADSLRPWVEPFANLEPDRQHPGAGFAEPHLEFHLTIGNKEDGALDRAADALVSRLITLVEEQEIFVGVGAKAERLNYGHIVILCRAAASFAPYEDALERAGVPFLTVAGKGFYQRAEIRDLLNALQALADPTDDLALVGLLRSPALALSDEALYHLRQASLESSTSLWDSLKQGSVELSDYDQGHVERAITLIEQLHSQIGRIPVADLLKQFVDLTDYRAALIQAGQKRSARNVAKLLTDAATINLVGVTEFLAYINHLRDTDTREGEARAMADGAVQLMTIHAAKGLEFPIVVIGDISHESNVRDKVILDPELGILLSLRDETKAASSGYRLGKLLAQEQEEAEAKRLLYVAVTRAEEMVLFSGYTELNKGDILGKGRGWLKELSRPEILGLTDKKIDYKETGSRAIELTLAVGEVPIGCTIYEPGYNRKRSKHRVEIDPEWPTPLPPPFLRPITTPPTGTARSERPAQVWRVIPTTPQHSPPAWVVGNLVHKALAAWRFSGNDFEAWLAAQALNYGLIDDHQVNTAVQQSGRLLRRFQSHPLYHVMNQAAQRFHEVPYTTTIDEMIETGSIDALFRQAETWTVVEFKTDTVRDEVEGSLLLSKTDYLAQIQRYQHVVRQMLGREPEVILCWLNYAGKVHLQIDLVASYNSD